MDDEELLPELADEFAPDVEPEAEPEAEPEHDESDLEDGEGELVIPKEPPQMSEILITDPDQMLSSDILSDADLTSVLTERATDIGKGAAAFVDTTGCATPLDVAMREILEKRSPMCVFLYAGISPAGIPIVEKRSVNDMGMR
jgi:hypothetical protein